MNKSTSIIFKYLFLILIYVKITYPQLDWISIPSSTNYKLNDIQILDTSTAVIVGDNGTDGVMLRSSDKGSSWNKIIDQYHQGLQSTFFTNNLIGYCVGWYGTILKTTDGGINWADIGNLSITTEPLYGLYFFNQNSGFFVGGNGTIIKTFNGGGNLLLQQISSQELKDIHFINQDIGYIISKGRPGRIYRTSDQGLTWNEIYSEGGSSEFFDIYFVNSNVGYIVGGKDFEGSILLKTTNGGSSWIKVPIFYQEWIKAIHFKNNDYGVCVGTNGFILTTSNSGINWLNQQLPTSILHAVKYMNDEVIAIGDYGRIYKSTTHNTFDKFITIMSPTGGEIYNASQYLSISWYCQNISIIKIEFSSDDGNSWSLLHENVNATDSTFVWQIPNIVSNSCKIKLSDFHDNNFFSISNKFTISPISQSDKIILTIPKIYARKNDTILVDILVKIPTNFSLNSSQISLTGFSQKLNYVSLNTLNTIVGLANWTFTGNYTNSILSTSGNGTQIINGEGTLFRILFHIPQNAEGFIPINFNSANFNSGSYPLQIENGGVTISSKTAGDIDLNGQVQSYDAALLLKYLTGNYSLSLQQQINADVNSDGTINSMDASLILQYVNSLIPKLPHQNIKIGQGNLLLEQNYHFQNNFLDIPIQVTNSNNTNAFEFNINYDESKMQFNGIAWSNFLNQFIKEIKLEDNVIKLFGAGPNDIPPNGTLLTLNLSKKSTFSSGVTTLSLNKLRWNANPISTIITTSTISPTTNITKSNELYNFELEQNYPNPFNSTTKINYEIPYSSSSNKIEKEISLIIYDILGNRIDELINTVQEPGKYSIVWDSQKFSSGVYYYEIRYGTQRMTRKMILLK